MPRDAIKCLVIISVGLLSPIMNEAQVRLTVSACHYKHQAEIRASVQNVRKIPITFCLEVGQQSPKGDEFESTPYPFWVQRFNNGRWGGLMNGPDVGSSKGALVLQAGESREFPFRLNESGKLRLRMNYWTGSSPNLSCATPGKAPRVATSHTFRILDE